MLTGMLHVVSHPKYPLVNHIFFTDIICDISKPFSLLCIANTLRHVRCTCIVFPCVCTVSFFVSLSCDYQQLINCHFTFLWRDKTEMCNFVAMVTRALFTWWISQFIEHTLYNEYLYYISPFVYLRLQQGGWHSGSEWSGLPQALCGEAVSAEDHNNLLSLRLYGGDSQRLFRKVSAFWGVVHRQGGDHGNVTWTEHGSQQPVLSWEQREEHRVLHLQRVHVLCLGVARLLVKSAQLWQWSKGTRIVKIQFWQLPCVGIQKRRARSNLLVSSFKIWRHAAHPFRRLM